MMENQQKRENKAPYYKMDVERLDNDEKSVISAIRYVESAYDTYPMQTGFEEKMPGDKRKTLQGHYEKFIEIRNKKDELWKNATGFERWLDTMTETGSILIDVDFDGALLIMQEKIQNKFQYYLWQVDRPLDHSEPKSEDWTEIMLSERQALKLVGKINNYYSD